MDSSDLLVGSVTREDIGKEVYVKEAHIKTKEELKVRDVRNEACRSADGVGQCDVAHKKECVI